MFGLPLGTLISIASGLIKIAQMFMASAQSHRDFSAGEDRQLSKSLVELTSRLQTFKEVEAEYAKMTDAQIKTDIEGQGDFRD